VVNKGLPEPGMGNRYHLAIQQSDHTIPYMDFEGEIERGYGKGKVKLDVRQQADVYHADPNKLRFNLYDSLGPQEFTLRRVGDREFNALISQGAVHKKQDQDKVWALHNKTRTQEKMKLPLNRPPYRSKKPGAAQKFFDDPNNIVMPKLDGAHTLIHLEKGQVPRVISYREPKKKRPGGVIEHTHKVPSVLKKKVPAGLGGLVLRGETIGMKRSGRPVTGEETGGLLNSSVWRSRKDQRRKGIELKQFIFDVARYRGRDATDLPYKKKLEILGQVEKEIPALRIPPIARTGGEAAQLLKRIGAGKEKLTTEGVVIWPLEGGRPIRVKFRDDHDVYVREIFPEEGKRGRMAGGFTYSHTPTGPIVGKVGTGMKHALKRQMIEDPESYIGRVAKVSAERKTKTGALTKPSFEEWHLDKGKQPMAA
jgi:ATP-dependent DNA ligase